MGVLGFKNSHITRMDAWSITEESDAMPGFLYPAYIGSATLGVGLDGSGLQALPDPLGPYYQPHFAPFHYNQGDLYILHEGMIASHLWDDEIAATGKKIEDRPEVGRQMKRNYLPLGRLACAITLDGRRYEGDDLRKIARYWQRDWSLRDGVVRTSYAVGENHHPRCRLSIEAFAPHGGQTVYLRLNRTGARDQKGGDFQWEIRLDLATRAGLAIFDQPEAIQPGNHTLLARIDEDSRYQPAEPYTVLYGVRAEQLRNKEHTAIDEKGWRITLRGDLAEAQEVWIRMDFLRLAGKQIQTARQQRDELEAQLQRLDRPTYEDVLRRHLEDWHTFWQRTADVLVDDADPLELRRRWVLHMGQYLLRCGNDQSMGGTAQTMLSHQNGWKACNFHDHHYIIDAAMRSNLWNEGVGHLRWMKKVMKMPPDSSRPFPWMMTYDGVAPVPPEQDRAPMSDANRALLAMRTCELAGGSEREVLLGQWVWPIMRRVSEHLVEEWLAAEDDGLLHLKAVENDVMNETPQQDEPGTVAMFKTVLLKSAQYARELGETELAGQWESAAGRLSFPMADGFYLPHRGGAGRTSPWFENAYYISEAQRYLDEGAYLRTVDEHGRITVCNYAWLNGAAASSQIRAGRADWAEQYLVDSLLHRLHGPGYFEEVSPIGLAALPPFLSAYGSHVTACLEQLVLPDFWDGRKLWIGRGLPAVMLARGVCFSNIRAQRGILVSGRWESDRARVDLRNTADAAVDLSVCLRLPARLGLWHSVEVDGHPARWRGEGDAIWIEVSIPAEESRRIDLVPGRPAPV